MAVKEKAISKSASGSKGGAKAQGASSMVAELFRATPYKRNQGRTVRLVTALTIGLIVALSAWRLKQTLVTSSIGQVKWIAPAVLLGIGCWLAYRVVHIPKFAEFLIAVEAEMSKVSWPTKTELYRSSVVVIVFIIALAAILFVFDLVWRKVFELIGVI